MNRCFLFLVLSTLLIGACAPQPETMSLFGTSDQGEIVIGGLVSLSGAEEPLGRSAHAGMMLAVDEINAAGGVNGRTIRLVVQDTGSEPKQALDGVSRLVVENHVVAVLGASRAVTWSEAVALCQRQGVPYLGIGPSERQSAVRQVGRDYLFMMPEPSYPSVEDQRQDVVAPISFRNDQQQAILRSEFERMYRERHDASPDSFAAAGYDAARVLVAALERAGTPDGSVLRDSLAMTDGFTGVTGTLTFKTPVRREGETFVALRPPAERPQ
ncbi:MAG TPA: ABC transporter substrate-binding protein [Thermoanaerobaculia bacterium]